LSGVQQREFNALLATVTARIAGEPLDEALQETLNAVFPPDGELFSRVRELCHTGRAEGWLCTREADGIRFGRVIKPGPSTHGFSVDVVEMRDIRGPFHAHPQGEIDMIIPVSENARFDGHGEGWLVYEAGSSHFPTVTEGTAFVVYLLPAGEIDFTAVAPHP
jgi:hypothetical protein